MKKTIRIILTALLVSFVLYSCARESVVSAIRLNFDEVVMKEGKDTLLIATIEPSGYSGAIFWESMNSDVAGITQDGRVIALGGGRTFVLAKAGGVSKGCAVTVKTDIKSISFTKQSLMLAEDGYTTLEVVTEPLEVFATKLIWESSNKEVVVVAEGLVRAEGLGQATITVWSEDNPMVRTSIEVTVAKLISEITLSQTSAVLYENKTLQLSAIVSPAECDYPEIRWYSTDSSVASVDQNGLVTTHKTGQAKIVVEAVTGSVKAECNLTVREPLPNPEGDESVEDLQPGTGYEGWTDLVE